MAIFYCVVQACTYVIIPVKDDDDDVIGKVDPNLEIQSYILYGIGIILLVASGFSLYNLLENPFARFYLFTEKNN